MKTNVFEELKGTIHFTNRSGVRATCPDCHVPHDWTDKIARKMQASKEVWGKIFGTIDTREKFLALRKHLAEHEWARMKANDSLECRNCHSGESMDLTKQNPRAAAGARALPVHRREDLHRLPQGHRPPAAEHVRRPGMAMMYRGISALGALARLCLAATAWGAAAIVAPVAAQPIQPAARSRQVPDAETFLRLAHSAAVLQAQAAELAASRDTRPEVRAFATRMAEFRREQIASLLSAARERTLAVSPVPALEHKVILENLEPLDSLELSRRYSEVQVQALEQEMAAYAQAESSPDGWVATVARDSKARLQGLLDEARQVRQTIGR